MSFFSIDWERLRRHKNFIDVQITFLDERGGTKKITKYYEQWFGVCTSDIRGVVRSIKQHFPRHNVAHRLLGNARKILPYFEERLATGKLDYRSKPFYKVYTSAPHENVGRFFHRYKIAYFEPDDWAVRIYIDFCTRFDTHAFYYRWYEIDDSQDNLVDCLRMLPERRDSPDWTVAAFDLESVPLQGNHVPVGHFESDRIVMMSVCKWNAREGVRKHLLYVLPEGATVRENHPSETTNDDDNRRTNHLFRTESEMLIAFHDLLEDAQVVTGYNINAFDFPCIFARLLWLRLHRVLRRYSFAQVGSDSVVTYRRKKVLDLYTYFKTFSNYGLPTFKLDDVARVKLGGGKEEEEEENRKLQVKSTGLWSWYRNPTVSVPLLESEDVESCFRALRPETVSDPTQFGTFRTYMDYCMRDSELVHRLFEKEHVLSFLIERAHFTALSVVQVLHLGNSRYVLELFKTYGTRLGYFFNADFFDGSPFVKRLSETFSKKKQSSAAATFQGALNYCVARQTYEDVSVMDFASMYPRTLLSSRLCYGTCTLLTREEWLEKNKLFPGLLIGIPYREHSARDFETTTTATTDEKTTTTTTTPPPIFFSYPTPDPDRDETVVAIHPHAEAFLPTLVDHFLRMRRRHQRAFETNRDDLYHHNVQLAIKILLNSLYGVMGTADSPLAYLPIAMTITTLSRYQLLGSFRHIENGGHTVCYADTDSLMVHRWPANDCDSVNAFLNLPDVELQYERRFARLFILCKKRYVYQERVGGPIFTKGFQKKTNGLVAFMTREIVEKNVWPALFSSNGAEAAAATATASDGWIVWVDTLLEANYRCRDPKKYAIYRKVKTLDSYKSTTCPSVKFLRKYPDKSEEHVEFTYGRADVACKEASNWVMDAQDCECVDLEKLFAQQKSIFCTLLNEAYWHSPDPVPAVDAVSNALRWKRFVHAELLHRHATGRGIAMLVEPGVKYTFRMNDHRTTEKKRGRSKKMKTD